MKAIQTKDNRTEFVPYYANFDGELVNEVNMGSPIYMTPIVANDVMYIATRKTLYAIESIETESANVSDGNRDSEADIEEVVRIVEGLPK